MANPCDTDRTSGTCSWRRQEGLVGNMAGGVTGPFLPQAKGGRGKSNVKRAWGAAHVACGRLGRCSPRNLLHSYECESPWFNIKRKPEHQQ